jgi:hypothetical protein
MKQNAHYQAALGLRLDRDRASASTAARHGIFLGNFPRHFSSPDGFGLVRSVPGSSIATLA